MSRRALLVGVLCFALGLGAVTLVTRVHEHLARVSRMAGAPPLDRAGYERRESQFRVLPADARIAIIGDSRVQEGEWHELLGRADVANRGISGDTTAGLLARLPQSVPAGARICVIQIGINDALQQLPPEEAMRNFAGIVTKISQLQPSPKIVLTPVIFAANTKASINTAVAELNTRLRQLAAERQLGWIDLNATLCPEGMLEAKWTNGGVHLNGDAYRAIAAELQRQLPAD